MRCCAEWIGLGADAWGGSGTAMPCPYGDRDLTAGGV